MREYLDKCRFFFIYAGVFSLFINLLLLTSPLYMMQVFDRVMASRSGSTLMVLTVAALFAYLVMGALEMLRSRLLVRASVALDGLLGRKVLAELLRHAVKQEGNPYYQGLRDVQVLRDYLTGSTVFAFFDAPWAPIFILLVFIMNPLLGAIALVATVVLFFLALLEEQGTRKPLMDAQARAGQTGQFVGAALRNAEVVNAHGMMPEVARRWGRMNDVVIGLQTTASNHAGMVLAWSKFIRMSLQIVMLAVGTWLVISQHVSPGIMMAATLILGRAMAPVEMVISSWRSLVIARDAYRRLNELLKSMPAESDPLQLTAPQGRMTVERLVYAPSPAHPIIKGISLELFPGESLGLIGPSAAGKSTLARLLLGIWAPTAGAVRLDGADVSKWQREHLGRYIGYLPQDVELFAGTVAENIARLGDPGECSEEVIAAARRAHAHDFILRLPKGYDTELGDGGTGLSGGQRQRIALARALFGNPRLVILDEPNSNLDGEGEEALIQAMMELKAAGATLVVITHKPSLLNTIDKVMVLQNGLVEMFGPRQEVLARVLRPGPSPAAPAASRPQVA